MKLSYDPKYNIAYLRFIEKTNGVESIKISEEMVVDISPDGKIYGLELLNANEQLEIIEGGKFIFTDESTGKTVQLPIAVERV
jgi:uncharacterized protein YuzE